MRTRLCVTTALALLAGLAACGEDSDPGQPDGRPAPESEPAGDEAEQRFPTVLDVTAEATGERTFSFEVTISSPYDSPERYADGWRVLTPDGDQLAEHELLHDHANEQPFTRQQTGVEVPEGVREVVIEGRDSENGYGGETQRVELP